MEREEGGGGVSGSGSEMRMGRWSREWETSQVEASARYGEARERSGEDGG